MSREFPVTGLAEIDKFLSYLPQNLQKNAVRAALVAAAKPIRDEVRARAPLKTGTYSKGIKTGSARQNQDGTFSVTVRATGRHAFLGVMLEWGVAPHFIQGGDSGISPRLLSRRGREMGLDVAARKGAGANRPEVLDIGGVFVSGAVHHPGFAARPHWRPGLDAQAENAVAAFARRIGDYIEGKTGLAVPLDEAA